MQQDRLVSLLWEMSPAWIYHICITTLELHGKHRKGYACFLTHGLPIHPSVFRVMRMGEDYRGLWYFQALDFIRLHPESPLLILAVPFLLTFLLSYRIIRSSE